MRITRFVTAVIIGLSIASAPALAIIWSGPDGDGHPYVGMAVFDVGGLPSHLCSGTLLSETVFLTAAHCTDGTSGARVWVESAITDPFWPFSGGTAVDGTTHTYPGWTGFLPDSGDVGVIVLDSPIFMAEYGELADVGRLDGLELRRGLGEQHFTIVGYGTQAVIPSPVSLLVRYVGTPQLVTSRSALTGGFNIQLSSNPGRRAPGGACFGDSGGPSLIGDTNVVAGVASFVLSQTCTGAGVYYRVDTPGAHAFVSGFLD